MKKELSQELDGLLQEELSSVLERERMEFDRLVEPYGKSLVLFGAGNLGRRILKRLRQDGVEPLAFADNNPALHGKHIDGLEVFSRKEAAEKFGAKAAFVVTIWNTEHSFVQTKQQLLDLNCVRVVSIVPLRWKYAEDFLPFLWSDLPSKVFEEANEIKATFSLWSDELSRKQYVDQVKWRISGSFEEILPPVQQESYFLDNLFHLTPDEAFVDCGAYNGITIERLLRHIRDFDGRILAYEPDPINYRDLQEFIATLPQEIEKKTIALPVAVSAQTGKVLFDASGTMGSSISDFGSLKVDCVKLDESLENHNFTPTYIKMDIEGGETDAIKGAQQTILKDTPILAVCLYHRRSDLWRIPMLLKTLSSKYSLFLRLHGVDGWDLVCYAVPEERLQRRLY